MDLNNLRKSLSSAKSSIELVENIAKCLEDSDLYFGHGTNNSLDESHWIVRSQQDWSEDKWNQKPNIKLIDQLVSITEKRVLDKIPLAYILGEAFFADLRFNVNRDVLIPRSPLAELIQKSFSPWLNLNSDSMILEIGTGSGCIAIAISRYCNVNSIDASDISSNALIQAKENIVLHKCNNIKLIKSNLYENISNKYDLIISNPPYVPEKSFKCLPAEYQYEPALALKADDDGLFIIKKILKQSIDYLNPGGNLIIEVSESKPEFERLYHNLPVIWIEFYFGGEGVFLVSKEQLLEYFST